MVDKKEVQDILLKQRKDQRLLSNVRNIKANRIKMDRRGEINLENYERNPIDYIKEKKAGLRYRVDYDVIVKCKFQDKWKSFICKSTDISTTGILLNISNEENLKLLEKSSKAVLQFKVLPGSMPEGYEMKVKVEAEVKRVKKIEDGYLCGLEFEETLSNFTKRKKDRYFIMIASILLFVITLFIMLMRAESVIYFKYNRFLYLYSIIAAFFLLSRYIFGAFYKADIIDVDFTPGISIIIPCFNEEEWIKQTIMSCMNQDYPLEQLEVIVVDDCSTDGSVEKIKEAINELYKDNENYLTKDRICYHVQEVNKGKRDALAIGAKLAKHDLLVFVDSDSFLDPFAIRNLVQPFKDPKMGGVSGRTDVANTYTNWLTKMQSVRYYIAFRIMKAAEGVFDSVTCLSGPLACYKKSIVLENTDAWLGQKFLGHPATFGDDRSMTNFVLRNHRTTYQDSAICNTVVPNELSVFLKQQMRWKRSWLRESIIAGKFMWRKEPFMAVSFYIGLIVPIAAPIVVVYNLIYVPISQGIFPTTFLVGLLMMAALMSTAQMFLRRSSTWLYGLIFCIFYEVVLLWQMPIAWVTFWKSTWGTRMTPQDVEELKRKERRIALKKQSSGGRTVDEHA